MPTSLLAVLITAIVSSGFRFTASGAIGVRRCSSSSRKRLWPGIAKASAYWSWKVRHGQEGRPAISRQTRDLIRRMCCENLTWGAPRIHGELLKLGIDIGESSVSSTWSAAVNRRLGPGEPFWKAISRRSSRSIFYRSHHPFPGPVRVPAAGS
jgi:hypothetical protein